MEHHFYGDLIFQDTEKRLVVGKINGMNQSFDNMLETVSKVLNIYRVIDDIEFEVAAPLRRTRCISSAQSFQFAFFGAGEAQPKQITGSIQIYSMYEGQVLMSIKSYDVMYGPSSAEYEVTYQEDDSVTITHLVKIPKYSIIQLEWRKNRYILTILKNGLYEIAHVTTPKIDFKLQLTPTKDPLNNTTYLILNQYDSIIPFANGAEYSFAAQCYSYTTSVTLYPTGNLQTELVKTYADGRVQIDCGTIESDINNIKNTKIQSVLKEV